MPTALPAVLEVPAGVFIDAKREIVIVEHSSQAAPLDAGLIALTSRFVSEVRKALS